MIQMPKVSFGKQQTSSNPPKKKVRKVPGAFKTAVIDEVSIAPRVALNYRSCL